MTKAQEEICITLILSACRKSEVYNAFNNLFKNVNQDELKLFVSINWDKHYKNQSISLHKKRYEDIYRLLSGLFSKKENGEIKKIKCNLVSSIEKKIPLDVYNMIIGPHLTKRELLRGKEVELIGFSTDKMKVIIRGEGDFFQHDFTIWDIDCRHGLKIIM